MYNTGQGKITKTDAEEGYQETSLSGKKNIKAWLVQTS